MEGPRFTQLQNQESDQPFLISQPVLMLWAVSYGPSRAADAQAHVFAVYTDRLHQASHISVLVQEAYCMSRRLYWPLPTSCSLQSLHGGYMEVENHSSDTLFTFLYLTFDVTSLLFCHFPLETCLNISHGSESFSPKPEEMPGMLGTGFFHEMDGSHRELYVEKEPINLGALVFLLGGSTFMVIRSSKASRSL